MKSFKNRNSFRERKVDCDRILLKYPDRIPVSYTHLRAHET